MRPQAALEEVRTVIKQESNLPSRTNFVDEEPATSAEHANIKLPIVSLEIASVDDIDVFNTDLDEQVLDNSGNVTGQIFRAEYEMGIQIDLMTAAESSFSRDELGTDIWNSLYPYVDEGPDAELHPDVWMFRIDDEETVDDFSTTPTLRMWRMNCTIGSFSEFETTETFIEDYNLAGPDVN